MTSIFEIKAHCSYLKQVSAGCELVKREDKGTFCCHGTKRFFSVEINKYDSKLSGFQGLTGTYMLVFESK